MIVSSGARREVVRTALFNNPFIPISNTARVFVVIYFLVWRVLPRGVEFLSTDGTEGAYAAQILFFEVLVECLLLLPFLLGRIGGSKIGWLHPLVAVPMISVFFGIIREPTSLLLPISVWFMEPSIPSHDLLGGWSTDRILQAQLLEQIAKAIALGSTLIGFAILRLRKGYYEKPVELLVRRIIILFISLLAIILFFLGAQGGIIAHMSTLASGRFVVRESSGHFMALTSFLPYLLILVYLNQPRLLINPVFLGGFLLAALLQFIVGGSRSGMIAPLVSLMLAWMFVNRKLPALRASLLGFVAVLSLSALGDIRGSGRDGSIDFSAIWEFNIASAWEASQNDLADRDINADLAVFAKVPSDVGYLNGVTYVAAVGFLIPRSIWREKPRGGGSYAAALLFRGLPTVDGYTGASFPISGFAEAYWSFDLVGVVLVFLIFGAVMRYFSDWGQHNPTNPFALTSLILMIVFLDQPNTASIVSFLQLVTLLMFTYLIATRRMR